MSSLSAGNTILNGFRFSLSSTDPAPASDILAATTGYLVPFYSDSITLVETGGSLIIDSSDGASISFSFSSFTAGTVYRIFASDPSASGTITLSATAWSSISSPGSSLALSPAAPGGFLVLSSNSTLRYIADVYCTANGEVNDAVKDRGVFNNENRIGRRCAASDTTTSWTVADGTTQSRDANTTYGVGRFGLMIGTNDVASIIVSMDGNGESSKLGGYYQFGFQVDSTSGFARSRYATELSASLNIGFSANWIYQPSQGRHYFQAMEHANAYATNWVMQGASPESVLEAIAVI